MRSYTYRGYHLRATELAHADTGRRLYEIDGLKPAGTRPFLTSVAQCREFIAGALEMGYWVDGGGYVHRI